MKKIIIPAITLLAFVSCKKAQDAQSAEFIATDSTLVEQTEEDEVLPDEPDFLSPDLQRFDLHGSARTAHCEDMTCDKEGRPVENAYVEARTYVFTSEGMLDVGSKELDWRLSNPRLTRNEEGYISKVAWRIEEYDSDVTETYTYNPGGYLISAKNEGIEFVDEATFTYNDFGQLTTRISEGAGEGIVMKETCTYTILEEDERGNWVRRMRKVKEQSGPDDGSNKYDYTNTYYQLEVRTISYY